MLDSEDLAVSPIREYLRRTEAALNATDAALSALFKNDDGIRMPALELHVKHHRSLYHMSLSRLHADQGDIAGCIAEQSTALRLSRELPSDAFLDEKVHILNAIAKGFKYLGRRTEAISALEEVYEMQCCENGPADFKLQVTIGELVQLYEQEGMFDKAEQFARTALDNVLTHGKDEEGKVPLEAFISHALAITLTRVSLRLNAKNSSASEIAIREARLDEAERLYKRSFDIYVSDCGSATFNDEQALDPLTQLTGLMVDRKKFTPELERLLEREIALSRVAEDDWMLSAALSKMCKYSIDVLRRPGSSQSEGTRTSTEDKTSLARLIISMAEEGVQLQRGLGSQRDDEEIRIFLKYIEILSPINDV
jgi:tetratricopeptide (TPR) repeat protein